MQVKQVRRSKTGKTTLTKVIIVGKLNERYTLCTLIINYTITTMIRVLVLNNYRNILTTRKIYATSHFAPCAAFFKKEREARRRRRDITIYSVKLD